MEGVSPYVNTETFSGFLNFLARNLLSGSRVAYDFKLRGSPMNLGVLVEPRTVQVRRGKSGDYRLP